MREPRFVELFARNRTALVRRRNGGCIETSSLVCASSGTGGFFFRENHAVPDDAHNRLEGSMHPPLRLLTSAVRLPANSSTKRGSRLPCDRRPIEPRCARVPTNAANNIDCSNWRHPNRSPG